jgi:hypothetical protein
MKNEIYLAAAMVQEVEVKITNLNNDFIRVIEMLIKVQQTNPSSSSDDVIEIFMPTYIFDQVA